MNHTWFTVLLFILGLAFLSDAQTTLSFEHLSTPQGLSQSTVRSICQDREGFMWFGTHNGLNRYDGYSFTVFKPDPRDPKHTFHHNIITDIHEDRRGLLWAATLGSGLHLVDKLTGNVTAYEIGSGHNSSLNTLFSIHEDAKGFLWIATARGLARFDTQARQYTLYTKQKYLVAVTQEQSGRFWVGGIQGVQQFDRQTGTFTHVLLDSTFDRQPFISSLCIDADGLLWAGSLTGGLWRMDTKRSPLTFTRYNPRGEVNKAIRYNGIYSDKAGHLWLATSEGLQGIDTKTDRVITYQSNASRQGSLSNNSIQSLFQDRAGTLWVGTNSGVNKGSAYSKSFTAYQVIPSLPTISLNSNYINTLLEDRTGTIWLGSNAGNMDGSFKNGLFRFDPRDKQIRAVPLDTSDPASKDVLTVYEDRRGRLWMGAATGLYQLNRATGRFVRYAYPFSVYHMVADRNGTLWLPSASAGDSAVLTAFDPDKAQFTYYRYNEKDTSGLNNPFYYGILASRNGDIYLATGGGGINRLNPKTGKFRHYMPNYQSPTGHINDKEVRCLYEDDQGIIWAGTGLGGLNRLDPRTGKFTAYTTQEGLPSNRILSIIGDLKGHLWMGTTRGLSRFDPITNVFRNYDVRDGLPDNDFLTGAVQNHKGKLLFGTRNGFVMFYPDSVRDNAIPPPVYITGFTVLGKRRAVPSDHIELAYQENFLSFEFVALNYNTPEKNQYAYQLVGVDKKWVQAGTRRFANYTNLAPGDYTFRVKASNDDGVWNEKGASIHVIIQPPWWQTIWFRLSAIVILLLLAGISIRLYTQARLRRQRTALKRVLQVQEEERQRLAADLHDDLGATLSAIKGQLETVHQTSDELARPIDLMEKAIRDLRHISHNLMPPEFARLGLTEAIHETVRRAETGSGLHFLFITHGQERRFDNETELTIYRIAIELINNAVKHAKAKQITIQLIFYPQQVSLLVEDDGRGYPINEGISQSGIGLRNIRSRVAYLQSKLLVDSGERGTTITLEVPL
ncbi:two-component regulator propeller domain-containing protein [Spirosoma endbachense]|uniref:Histidine kinase n=1 Tax=Spirosoma endbachense TaxID=2666025 RepID=A0A6P1W0C3_9BACT|nr:two-component regulator propeller domain-containing protein [Spirosoma endbachense]QHV97460.1 histidine kinase [Spirosoma endbachense]